MSRKNYVSLLISVTSGKTLAYFPKSTPGGSRNVTCRIFTLTAGSEPAWSGGKTSMMMMVIKLREVCLILL